jgi:hypothetical protein
MRWFDSFDMRLVSLLFMVSIVLSGSVVAKADFTFGIPVNLGSPLNNAYADVMPSISSDGLEVYFWSNRPGGFGDWDLWMSTRASIEDEWKPATNLGAKVNSSGLEAIPCVSADGLELFFSLGSSATADLMVAQRTAKMEPWGTPVNLGPVVNSSVREDTPRLTSDGLELYFISNRSGGRGLADIWVATRPTITDDWAPPVNLSTVNSSAYDQWVNISGDGLTLLFQSTRSGGEYGGLYMSRRKNKDDPWTVPVYLGLPMNGSVYTLLSSVSADGTMLYLSDHINFAPRAGGNGSADMWQVPVITIVDFNGDEIVDSEDMCLMIDHWNTDEPLYDIAPPPFGDGIVDVQDLIALAEHLFEEVNDPTLMAHWALDETEGMFAVDSVGDNDAVVLGGAEWQSDGGQIGGALQLNGVDGYAIAGAVLNPADGPFSVFAWMKGGAPGQIVLSQINGANWLGADMDFGCVMTELMPPAVGRFVPQPLISESIITDGQWHRIGFVWDGANSALYVDDILVAEDKQNNLSSSLGGLNIGCGSNSETGTFWSGLIDDVSIYNRAVRP